MSRLTLPVVAGGRSLSLRPHAVDRYQERVKPMMTVPEAEADLRHMLSFAEFGDRPPWTQTSDLTHPDTTWLLLGDAIAFAVVNRIIVTCVTRGEVGADIRVTRQRERRQQTERQNRPGAKKKHGKVARDARRRARDAREAIDDGR